MLPLVLSNAGAKSDSIPKLNILIDVNVVDLVKYTDKGTNK